MCYSLLKTIYFLPSNCIFITKYLQISEINCNFAADYSKFINFIKTREIMMKRIAMLMGGVILSCGVAFAQTSVTGKVTSSDDGEPVVGASVRIDRF